MTNTQTHPALTQLIVTLGAALLVAASATAAEPSAKEPTTPNPEAQGGQSLDQAAQDPTASLMAFQLADWDTSRFHGPDDEDANTAVPRSVIPFKTGTLNHIFRR